MEPTKTVNDITELRTALFNTLRSLGDKDNPLDIDRAKAISEVAQTIINTAKVEIDHMKIAGGRSDFIAGGRSDFIAASEYPQITTRTQGGIKTVTQLPGGTVTKHQMDK